MFQNENVSNQSVKSFCKFAKFHNFSGRTNCKTFCAKANHSYHKYNRKPLQLQKHMATEKKCQAILTLLQIAHSLLPNLSLSRKKISKHKIIKKIISICCSNCNPQLNKTTEIFDIINRIENTFLKAFECPFILAGECL